MARPPPMSITPWASPPPLKAGDGEQEVASPNSSSPSSPSEKQQQDGSGGGGGAGLPPPFLTKTYEMIDDACTNAVVSWGGKGNSFVVWNPPELSKDLLPKYFKHNNFSSFVRQLNTYGFRKVDPDRWEFANEGFLRGQKHLLKNIHRRKPSGHHSSSGGGGGGSSASTSGGSKQKLEAEIEKLNRDKNVLMLELVRMRQQQQEAERELHLMGQRVQGTELRQHHMVSFLVKAIQNPGILSHLVRRSSIGESRKRKLLEHEGSGGGQIVSYEPSKSTKEKLVDFFSRSDLASKLEGPLELLFQELIPQEEEHSDEQEEAEEGECLAEASSEMTSLSSAVSNNKNSSSTPENLPPPTPPLLSLVLEVKQPQVERAASTTLEGEVSASVDSGALGVGINDVFWERFLSNGENEDAPTPTAAAPVASTPAKSSSVPWWTRVHRRED